MGRKPVSKIKLLFIPCQKNNYRPNFLESDFLVYFLIFLFLGKLFIFSFLIYFPKTMFFADISRLLLIELTNKERISAGLQPLEENDFLNQAALLKAQDILDYDYFSHQSPQGKTPWYWFRKAGYEYEVAGENLGIGFLDSQELHQAWKNSSSHRYNILNPQYQEIGIAVLKGDFQGNKTMVVVQLFGSAKQAVQKTEKEVEKIPETKSEKSEKIIAPLEEKEEKEKEEEKKVEGLAKENGLKFSFLKFIASNFADLNQKIIFYSLLFLIISLLINIFFSIKIQHPDLILRAVFFGLLLIILVILNKELLVQIIPHNFFIF
ncbi:MAG: CAP domain-containing protein [Patescibacteria group bacterium]|nr:CAP domain-containing protein [Patescibacteria group bacterium]